MTKIPGVPAQWSGPDQHRPTQLEFEAVRSTLQAIPMAAVAHTLDYVVIAANEECAAVFRLSPDEIAGRPVKDFIPLADRLSALDTARAIGTASTHEARPASSLRRLIVADGQEMTCWMHVGIAVIDGYRCFLACIDLVNPVLSDAHRWRHRAEHDELTGLRRRGALLAEVEHWIDSGRAVMLAFLDIDNFKSVNDTHGHAAGDHVLSTLSQRLEQHAPPGCAVGRLSGDEFVLSHPVGTSVDSYGRHADPMRERRIADESRLLAVGARCVEEPIAWGDHLLIISVSVGITISEPGEDASALLHRADHAMYERKSRVSRPVR
ncbi:diguanylate cyclase (GGDEF)-like protein [Nakamurella sp. UYEF19]|uniref:sensor domain-containing diguanylate cyclase n=1 Tax=Nakamurella sp. UYEF19 TaxID=1756392 RepID=UPI00339361A1